MGAPTDRHEGAVVQLTRAEVATTGIADPVAVRNSAAGIVLGIDTGANQAAFDVGRVIGAGARLVLAAVSSASGCANADTTLPPKVVAAAAPVEHREGGQGKEGEDIEGLHFGGREVSGLLVQKWE
jgi:hypothetical protein